jgi:hypothetical protein
MLGDDDELDLSWAPDALWKLMTGETRRDRPFRRISRRYFELCVFSQLATELKSGDICIPGSDQYADYRNQLISWEEYKEMIDDFGAQVGLAVEGADFVKRTREWLEEIAARTDEAFPGNASVRIENGDPVISRLERQPDLEQLQVLGDLIAERIDQVSILDVLIDTERWLNWTRSLGPISRHDAKLEDSGPRYVMTTFCYGCGFGPSQAARALKVIDRRQLAWINQRHVTEEKLDQINQGRKDHSLDHSAQADECQPQEQTLFRFPRVRPGSADGLSAQLYQRRRTAGDDSGGDQQERIVQQFHQVVVFWQSRSDHGKRPR